MDRINRDGKLLSRDEAAIHAHDHSYRYGDGLFETMKVKDGKILHGSYHFERLYQGLEILQIPVPTLLTKEKLEKEILALCTTNKHPGYARVRLSASAGQGGLYDSDEKIHYLIESWPLNTNTGKLNENGLVIDVYPDARKSCDKLSNIKSSSYLPYAMAARFAQKNKLNDALLINMYDNICDSTIANIFWIKQGKIFTPPLSEGCVAGVMRKYLLSTLNNKVEEKPCTIKDLESADEIFLTNAIHCLRWVGHFRNKTYSNNVIQKIYSDCVVF